MADVSLPDGGFRRAARFVALANLAYLDIEFVVAIGSVSLFADSIDFSRRCLSEPVDPGGTRLNGAVARAPWDGPGRYPAGARACHVVDGLAEVLGAGASSATANLGDGARSAGRQSDLCVSYAPNVIRSEKYRQRL